MFGQFYATPRAPILDALESGGDVLFDIDWQGARQLKKRLPRDVVRVFILPPNGEALERRLKTRNQDSEATVARRMAAAAGEIAHWNEYDYAIINHDVETSLAGLDCDRGRRTAEARAPSGSQSVRRKLTGKSLKAACPCRAAAGCSAAGPPLQYIGQPPEIAHAQHLASQRRIEAGR